MRKIIWLITLLMQLQMIAQDSEIRPLYNHDFDSGSYQYLFADQVKLRENASTDSEVLAILPINTMIKIILKSENAMEFDGVLSPWYRVEVDGKEGYILGALIALDRVSSSKTFTDFLFQVSRSDNDKEQLKVRTTQDNSTYEEAIFDLWNSDFDVEINSGKHLKGIDNIVKIDYISEACGIEGGFTYLIWNQEALTLLANVSQIADAGIFSFQEQLIFPTDEEGEANAIGYKLERITFEDDSLNWTKTVIIQRSFQWEGLETVKELNLFQRKTD
ncbi:SH3 domain-containing protein [Pustulibacterium marinum]|uniref:SH3 domain-containing protein n=1 Tax=Pustulibacterium marinum TaxID=1224947 RepID=A0A1I7G1A1_9FLAO|nr:SH3 domain-containing protein [Pustulibacterium marinum]SFU42213.1 SH3 domain-containing protein [Pustulibacterium marinum]